MSADGRYVVFITADALDPADTNGVADVYVRDLVAEHDDLGEPAGRRVGCPHGLAPTTVAISADGRYVSFFWRPSPIDPRRSPSLYRRDRQAGTTTKLARRPATSTGCRPRATAATSCRRPACFQGALLPERRS